MALKNGTESAPRTRSNERVPSPYQIASERKHKVLVLSDANELFIKAGLESMGLASLFSFAPSAEEGNLVEELLEAGDGRFSRFDTSQAGNVISNAAHVDEDDVIRISRCHSNVESPICPANLCKGLQHASGRTGHTERPKAKTV